MTTSVPQLQDLAATANREHDAVGSAMREGLGHALAAGAALTEAKHRVEGPWREWCETNLDFHHTTASWYVRIYTYRDELEAAGANSFKGAMRVLRQGEHSTRLSTPEVKRVYALLAAGVPQTEIARKVGRSKQAINHYARRRARSKPKPRWITHRRRASGGKWDRAYSHFRHCLAEIAELAPNGEPRWDEAYEHLYWLEDFLGKQMRSGR